MLSISAYENILWPCLFAPPTTRYKSLAPKESAIWGLHFKHTCTYIHTQFHFIIHQPSKFVMSFGRSVSQRPVTYSLRTGPSSFNACNTDTPRLLFEHGQPANTCTQTSQQYITTQQWRECNYCYCLTIYVTINI